MKKSLQLIILVIMAAVSAGCTQNGGTIGPLFGTWSLISMTVDGTDAEGFDPENTFWSFQSNIIRVVHTLPDHDYADRMGSWTATDNGLSLNFTHSDDNTAPGQSVWAAPEWLGFPSSGVFELTYLERPGNRMVLKWVNDRGETYVYSFRKTY